MSFRPERVFTGSSKNPTEYVREDIVQEMLEQQREDCANGIKLIDEANGSGIQGVIFKDEAIEACLNATGENDDK